VARKGARVVGEQGEDAERANDSASAAWRAAMARARDEELADPRAPWQPDQWIEDDPDDDGDTDSRDNRSGGARGQEAGQTGRVRPTRRIPRGVVDELAQSVGTKRAAPVVDRLADATRAYERERFQDARRMVKSLADEAPHVAAVRQLFGLASYRLGRWREAARELEAYHSLSSEFDQHAVLADAYRALGRHQRVDQLWEELRAASPTAEAVAEGRIVAAGSLADRGDLTGAIRLLEKATAPRRHPKEHHLRQWYVLADLYERAGDIPRARDLFNRIAAHRPETFDVDDRIRALR